MANAFFRSIYVLSLAALIGCIRDLDDLPALNLDNGLGRTPQMGWNSWNFFKCYVDEKVIIETADAMIKTGLASAGYNYVNVDDCWAELHRDSNGNLTARNTTFPSGIKSLADYVHSKGLKFGIYSDAGYYTCQRQPGSLGYEIQDAETFASWGVDYLKYDNCFNGGIKPQIRYKAMWDALNQTGRHIFYSICEWGRHDPAKWASAIGNSWRTTQDIKDTWKSVVKIADENNIWASYAGPGGWNDPDMLEVGNGGLSWEESRSHFSIWALMKAPLIIGCDVRNVTQEYLNIFLNKEVIAVNQDSLGVQGIKVSRQGLWKCREVWAGPLSENRTVVALWNRCANTDMIEARWKDIGIDPAIPLAGRNIWKHEDIGVHWGSFNASVAPHACEMYIFSPISSLNYSETPEDQ